MQHASQEIPDTPLPEGSVPRRRVLIAADTYPPDVNGAAYFTYRLATGLAERGNEVYVVCQSPSGPPRRERSEGVTLFRLRSAPILVHPTMRTAVPLGVPGTLARILDQVRPDVVHAQAHFTIGRAAIGAGRQAGVPVVLTNHFMPDNLFDHAHIPRQLRGLAGALAWRDMVRVAYETDHVTTPTQRAARLLASKGFSRPIEAVSCGIDLCRFQPRAAERREARRYFGLPDRETLLFVGRLDVEKRIDELIRAMPKLLTHRDVQLALVGVGKREADLRGLVAALGVEEHVRFLGFVPDQELPLAYVAADLFAIGSVAELQSIATLEAMATGLPVVAADALALPHLVRPGHNGYLYPPGDVDALADRLHAVLESPERARAMGAASREIALTHDHRRSLARFEEIYAGIRPGNTGHGRQGSASGQNPRPRRSVVVEPAPVG